MLRLRLARIAAAGVLSLSCPMLALGAEQNAKEPQAAPAVVMTAAAADSAGRRAAEEKNLRDYERQQQRERKARPGMAAAGAKLQPVKAGKLHNAKAVVRGGK